MWEYGILFEKCDRFSPKVIFFLYIVTFKDRQDCYVIAIGVHYFCLIVEKPYYP